MISVWRIGAHGVISASCAFLNVVMLVIGDAVGLNYVSSTILSFVICVLFGYPLHSRFTFGSSLTVARLMRYSAAMSVNLPGALVIMWLLHNRFSLPIVAAAPTCTLMLATINFFLNRWAITDKVHHDL